MLPDTLKEGWLIIEENERSSRLKGRGKDVKVKLKGRFRFSLAFYFTVVQKFVVFNV